MSPARLCFADRSTRFWAELPPPCRLPDRVVMVYVTHNMHSHPTAPLNKLWLTDTFFAFPRLTGKNSQIWCSASNKCMTIYALVYCWDGRQNEVLRCCLHTDCETAGRVAFSPKSQNSINSAAFLKWYVRDRSIYYLRHAFKCWPIKTHAARRCAHRNNKQVGDIAMRALRV